MLLVSCLGADKGLDFSTSPTAPSASAPLRSALLLGTRSSSTALSQQQQFLGHLTEVGSRDRQHHDASAMLPFIGLTASRSTAFPFFMLAGSSGSQCCPSRFDPDMSRLTRGRERGECWAFGDETQEQCDPWVKREGFLSRH